mgnify:CR=1 FL=1
MHNSQGLEKVLSLRQEILAGDEKRLKEQRDAGKLTARERIAKIADAGSFVELFALVSRNDEGAGVVTGYATIEERPVYLFAQDFTVRGGLVQKGALFEPEQLAEIYRALAFVREQDESLSFGRDQELKELMEQVGGLLPADALRQRDAPEQSGMTMK